MKKACCVVVSVLGGALAAAGCESMEPIVETFTVSIAATSDLLAAGDTLVGDTVRFSATVTRNGQVIQVAGQSFASNDPTVVEFLDPAKGRAVLRGVGQATVTVSFDAAGLPGGADLQASLIMRVSTFLAQLTAPDSLPMGDTVQFAAGVTRSGQPVAASGPLFESSDSLVLEFVDDSAGLAFVRDVGQTTVTVSFGEPLLPDSSRPQTSLPVNVTLERFYGQPSAFMGDFADRITVNATAVHSFVPGATRIEFANGVPGWIDEVLADTLRFSVPAGAGSGRLLLRALANGRDSVPTTWDFSATGRIDDDFEPNDTFPLVGLNVPIPFKALLSMDPAKAPADTNFFYFVLNPGQTLDFTARWQVNANVDFKVCSGNADPPTDYVRVAGTPICQFVANMADFTEEVRFQEFLSAGIYVVAYYCVSGACMNEPFTYRVKIQ